MIQVERGRKHDAMTALIQPDHSHANNTGRTMRNGTLVSASIPLVATGAAPEVLPSWVSAISALNRCAAATCTILTQLIVK